MNTKNFIYFCFIVGFSFLFICLVSISLLGDDSISFVNGYFVGMIGTALWLGIVDKVKGWLENESR